MIRHFTYIIHLQNDSKHSIYQRKNLTRVMTPTRPFTSHYLLLLLPPLAAVVPLPAPLVKQPRLHVGVLVVLVWRQLYENRSSRKIDSRRLFFKRI